MEPEKTEGKREEGIVETRDYLRQETPETIAFKGEVSDVVNGFCKFLQTKRVNGHELTAVVIVRERIKGEEREDSRGIMKAVNGTAVDFVEMMVTFMAELAVPYELIIAGMIGATRNKKARGES